MTATAPAAPQPTPEQLKAYADQLPEIYREILAAFQFADPNRQYGEGVLESTLKNYLRGKSMPTGSGRGQDYRQKRLDHKTHLRRLRSDKTQRAMLLSDDTVSLALERLAAAGLIVPPLETRLGSLIPTPLGESLIAAVTGVTPTQLTLPELPKLTW